MPAKRELESGLLDQPAMCTTVNSLHTGILETYWYIGDIQVYWRHTGILETYRVTHKEWTFMTT